MKQLGSVFTVLPTPPTPDVPQGFDVSKISRIDQLEAAHSVKVALMENPKWIDGEIERLQRP
jgi:hypothetical protein